MDTVTRRTGRVLPIHRARVLLIRGGDPGRPDAGEWWFTVGGGCELAESPAEAARREAFEEAGLVLPTDLGPVVLRREADFEFDGEWLQQTEEYYLCEVDSDVLTDAGWNELEQRVFTAQRWWSIDELRTTTEVVFPSDLADVLTRLDDPDESP
ncbi:NUDIX hydrolase [Microlunatus flavus]|uniref:ADP-ribose pyrophosphatase YjhB, NUDIX family n=1 Tax=Microlunatus flavus TaxID=1036181 RepID=A0A1H8ZGY0_9ACTN|nr:NUDIX domain-containing protein [Microlunatus flavus]SEP63672.1 ADP-ribose pyrophosphatase YjhB, NUDIX family [Microlunatus flavus]